MIERRLSSSFTYTVIAAVGKDVTQYDDQDIVLGLTYYYRVRVSDYTDYSGYTNEISIKAQPAFIIPPSNLQGYFAIGNIVRLTWSDNSNNETNFVIERAEDVALANFTQIFQTDADIVQFSDTTTIAGKTYSYRIRASDGVVFSSYSNTITIKNP